VPSGRVSSGVRFDSVLWASYKRLCLVSHTRCNELLELIMRKAVESGDLNEFLKYFGSNGGEDVVLETDLLRSLDELERLVGTGWFQVWQNKEGKGEWPALDQQIDELIQDIQQMLPRCQDPNILTRAKWLLPRAAFYFGMERWAGTAGSAQANILREACERLSEFKQIHEGPTEPVRLNLHEHANSSTQSPAKKA